jgi:hypothetical protein
VLIATLKETENKLLKMQYFLVDGHVSTFRKRVL